MVRDGRWNSDRDEVVSVAMEDFDLDERDVLVRCSEGSGV